MEGETLDPGVQLEGRETLSVSDEEMALCCCEYFDECGARRHLLQTFCDCAELDEFVNRSLNEGIDSRAFWNTASAVDRRIRLPTWNGAKHVGFAFVFAAVTTGVLYILLSICVTFSLALFCILPILMHRISRMILRAFPRTRFFYFLGYWCVATLILSALSTTSERFYNAKCISLIAFCVALQWLLMKIQKSSSVDSDVVSNETNCRICNLMIINRDHHCVWLNCCIGASNDHYFLCFMALASEALIVAAVCDMDLITIGMSGAVLYRTSLTVFILSAVLATLSMRFLKKSRSQPSL